ncbi:hypothetical protein [Polyangium aurulentum]|uniref:hypothetical protein n=1 Tax=Polyangium aurulentum TaxID=2567896 RepID=UPI0010AE7B39|nr:hypothetical protein [Polyangium aurulentum]UQA59289.1 hypothetical protein E8A73_001905 [Polyangium aurulentum]
MKVLRYVLGLGMGLGLVHAMGSAEQASAAEPTIIQHPMLDVPAVNVQPFLDAGCVRSDDGLDCSAAPAIQRFGCFGNFLRIDPSLGGLEPRVAIAECSAVVSDETAATTGIVRLGCRLPLYRRYVIASRGGFELVQSEAQFRERFGSVTSAAEALAFATALTTAQPQWKIALGENEEFLADRIETTHVDRIRGGYDVHLFDTERCGCSQHPTSAVAIRVSLNGRIQVGEGVPVYQDTQVICVD